MTISEANKILQEYKEKYGDVHICQFYDDMPIEVEDIYYDEDINCLMVF